MPVTPHAILGQIRGDGTVRLSRFGREIDEPGARAAHECVCVCDESVSSEATSVSQRPFVCLHYVFSFRDLRYPRTAIVETPQSPNYDAYSHMYY